jgi:hypothetical protein
MAGPSSSCTRQACPLCQKGRPTSTGPLLSDINEYLVMGPTMGLTPWQTGQTCRSWGSYGSKRRVSSRNPETPQDLED